MSYTLKSYIAWYQDYAFLSVYDNANKQYFVNVNFSLYFFKPGLRSLQGNALKEVPEGTFQELLQLKLM